MHSLTKSVSARRRRMRFLPLAALAVVSGVILSACSAPSNGSSDSGGPVTLKVSTFGESGAIKDLAKKYEKENPGVTVEVNTVASSDDARTNLLTKLAAGSGLADVEQLEISWIGQLTPYASKFVPVENDKGGDWVKAQADPVTLTDGKKFAYGLGLGPEAVCYKADMLQQAGLPSDPESVAKMVGGSWADFFAAGEKYVADGGQGGWYDSSYLLFDAQVEQMAYPYEDKNNKIVVDNPKVEKIFKDTLAAAPKLSAKLPAFSDDWNAGMASGKFATITCPSWMLTTIQGNAKDATDWNIANAFPGGGGNIGGSYFAVPTQGKHQAAASKLASWMSAPAQQVAQFTSGGAFPSRTKALDDPAVTSVKSAYFNNAPIGTIFGDRSKAITKVMYKGPHFIAIDTAAFNAMSRVEAGQQSIDDAWKQFIQESKAAAD